MKTRAQAIAGETVGILSLESVVGAGIGHQEARGSCACEPAVAVLGVHQVPEAALAQKHRVPKRIGRVVTGVVEVGELVGLNRQNSMRPVRPGTRPAHGHGIAGTYGVLVHDMATGEPLL
ncbi:MAG TPA: hypothetical protein DCM14_06520 [Clostridiales bacterium UBA8153]|nr:hypothetical protein [Clostridiales bacterium UBA8153]